MSELFVGIDPGLASMTMLAYSPEWGVVDWCKPKATQGKIPLGGVDRLSFIMHSIKWWITEVSRKGTIAHIGLEGYAPHAEFQREAAGESSAVIRLALVGFWGLDKLVAYPTIVAPTQLKKFTIGKGSGAGTGKEDMKLHAYKRWGCELTDNNAVDAYALARVVHALHCPGEPVTAFQQDVLSTLVAHTEWNRALHPDTKMGRAPSSKSVRPATQAQSPGSSPTLSTRVARSRSGQSEPVPSTRRLRRVPSPKGS